MNKVNKGHGAGGNIVQSGKTASANVQGPAAA